MSYFHYEELKSFLTVQETAKVLGVSIHTIYRLIHTGELISTKVGCRTKIKAEDLQKYIDRK